MIDLRQIYYNINFMSSNIYLLLQELGIIKTRKKRGWIFNVLKILIITVEIKNKFTPDPEVILNNDC